MRPWPALPGPLVQALAGGGQGLHDQRSHLRLESSPEDHHAVLGLIHMQGSHRMPSLRLSRLGPPIHVPSAPHDPLDVGGCAGAPYSQQPGFRLRRGHPGEGADLRVREFSAGQRLGEEGQSAQGARDPDPFPGRAQIEPHSPGEPGRAGAKARVSSAAGVECSDQLEQARGGSIEVGRELGDLVAEPIQLRGVMNSRRMDQHGEPSSY